MRWSKVGGDPICASTESGAPSIRLQRRATRASPLPAGPTSIRRGEVRWASNTNAVHISRRSSNRPSDEVEQLVDL